MSKVSSDKYTYSNDDNDYSKFTSGSVNLLKLITLNTDLARHYIFIKRRTSRGGNYTSRGRESVNSLDESSVRNSQSGTTDGASTASRINSKLSNNTNTSSNFMGSTDTINRNQRETLHSRFDFVKVLGKGTYGKVKLANDKRTGKQVILCLLKHFLLNKF